MIYPCIPAGILCEYSDRVREPESNKKSRSPFMSVVQQTQGCRSRWARGSHVPPPPGPLQILTDKLTLSQPAGKIMPTTLLLAPP